MYYNLTASYFNEKFQNKEGNVIKCLFIMFAMLEFTL